MSLKYKSVRFFCWECGEELWEGMDNNTKETTTIASAERTAICSDCTLENFKKENNK